MAHDALSGSTSIRDLLRGATLLPPPLPSTLTANATPLVLKTSDPVDGPSTSEIKRTGGSGIVTDDGRLSHGYWKVRVPPALRHLTNGANTMLERRLVMAQHLQRPLHPGEVVHHINGVRTDNRIENLELWSTTQPKGQRVDEKVAWAKELLRLYEPNALVGREREAAP